MMKRPIIEGTTPFIVRRPSWLAYLALALPLLSTATTAPLQSGCTGCQTSTWQTTTNVECITAIAYISPCGDDSDIDITNGCPTALALTPDPLVTPETAPIIVAPNSSGRYVAGGHGMAYAIPGTLGDEPLTLEISRTNSVN